MTTLPNKLIKFNVPPNTL